MVANDVTASRSQVTAEGYLHELGVYGSDEQFKELIVPFVTGGMDAGEPVVFAYDAHKTGLLQQWLPAVPAITYVTDTSPYATPAKALVAWRKVVESHLWAGARRVRIAGNVPHPGYSRSYVGWDRYESALDVALGDLPVWAPCLYDTRITPPDVLDTAVKRHQRVLGRDGAHLPNAYFVPGRKLAEFLAPPSDPLESTRPALELAGPTPAEARAAVSRATEGLVDTDERQDLVLATSEVVTNADRHGSLPLTMRMWTGERRVVVHVHDAGGGPGDPLAGLVPVEEGAQSGRGLWLIHQLDLDVALLPRPDGFTVRLRAGTPSEA